MPTYLFMQIFQLVNSTIEKKKEKIYVHTFFCREFELNKRNKIIIIIFILF
jgi:hypothetical protein